jgi:hypothetical protein
VELLVWLCVIVGASDPGNCLQVYEEGTHLVVPWFERPIIYDVRAKPVNIQSVSGSKDLQTVSEQRGMVCWHNQGLLEGHCKGGTQLGRQRHAAGSNICGTAWHAQQVVMHSSCYQTVAMPAPCMTYPTGQHRHPCVDTPQLIQAP